MDKFQAPNVNTYRTTSYTNEDLLWLSRAICGTGDECNYSAKVKIGELILNRVKDKNFPNTIKDVVLAVNKWNLPEFDMYCKAGIYGAPDKDSVNAAKQVLDGIYQRNLPEKVLYYERERCGCGAKPAWWTGVTQYTTEDIIHFGIQN